MRKTLTLALIGIAPILSACGPTVTQAGATEATLCRIWGESLPTRSHADTAQTQAEIAATYADFSQACPAFTALIP